MVKEHTLGKMEENMLGWKDGKQNGQGTFTSNYGRKYVGEWKDGERWNGKVYDKKGKILWKWKDGIKTGLL